MTRGLERALTRSAALAGAELAVERHRMTPWHSATFSGARHDILASAMSGDRLDQWLAQLPAVDLPLRGGLLTDIRVAACERAGAMTRLRIESVTLDTG